MGAPAPGALHASRPVDLSGGHAEAHRRRQGGQRDAAEGHVTAVAGKTYAGDRTMDGIQVSVDGRPLDPRSDLGRLSDRGGERSDQGPGPAAAPAARSAARPLDPRFALRRFSDGGFEWSYEGPEPEQLAFALLVDHLGDPAKAASLRGRFMREIVANFDNEWEMTSADLEIG